jgi:hypothetical protein
VHTRERSKDREPVAIADDSHHHPPLADASSDIKAAVEGRYFAAASVALSPLETHAAAGS